MDNKYSKQIIAKVIAWGGLLIITFMMLIILYAIISANGKLALAMIIALSFVSIIYWVGIKLYK